MYRLNETFYHDLATYESMRRLVKPVRLVVTNTGDVQANDVRLEIIAPVGQGYMIADISKIPDLPERRKGLLESPAVKNLRLRPPFRHAGYANIENNAQQIKVEIDCGSLQPGRKVWTDSFSLGIGRSGVVELKGHVYAANLSIPQEFSLKIDAVIHRTSMTVKELLALATGDDDE
jgi:hypothetical protein